MSVLKVKVVRHGLLVRALSIATLAPLATCAHPTGRMQVTTLQSKAEGRALRYAIYLPPAWDHETPLPLVVLLHGAGDDERSPDRRDVIEGLDAAIQSGRLAPFVLVAPEGDFGFWVNWYDGTHHYRDWVLSEVVPAVRARFSLLPAPDGLHLMGVSMGGGGGLQMWLHAREQFASVSVLSAPILNEQETRSFLLHFTSPEALEHVFGPSGTGSGLDPYEVLKTAADLDDTKLLFGAAEHDRRGILASNRRFHAVLAGRDVPHRFVVFEGRHAWKSWAQVFPYVLCQQLSASCRLPAPEGSAVDTLAPAGS